MNIWIMRHGEASFNAPSDAERALTENGINDAVSQGKWLGEYLIQNQIQLDKIIVSPYKRAQQTLEHLITGIQAVNFSQKLTNITETWDEITPEGNPHTVENYLQFLQSEGAKAVLLISHLPLVFDLTQVLTSHQGNALFPTATIAEIEWLIHKGKIKQVKLA